MQIDDGNPQLAHLGGQTPDAFFGRHGDVVSGAQTVALDVAAVQLLALPGELVVVDAAVADGALTLTIRNGTASEMRAVQSLDGTADVSITLPAAQDIPITLGPAQSPHRLFVQIFPSGHGLPDVVSLIVSSEQSAVAASLELVGQAFTGVAA